MAVDTSEVKMNKKEVREWLNERGLFETHLPKEDERFSYIPPCSYDETQITRLGDVFTVQSHRIVS